MCKWLVFLPLHFQLVDSLGTAKPWSPCVFVSTDHGQALSHWLDAAAWQKYTGTVAVIHADAHNDLDVPTDPRVFSNTWLSNSSSRRIISDAADLANFQMHAVWAGLVNRIAWLRPGNGPMEHTASSLLLDPDSMKFQQGAPVALAGGGTDIRMHDGAGSGRQYLFHEVFMDGLEKNSSEVELLLQDFQSIPYILDIDLDYFIDGEDSPGRPPWKLSGGDCRARVCHQWTDPDCALWVELESVFSSSIWEHPCEKVIEAWHRLSPQQRETINSLTELHMPERLLLTYHLAFSQTFSINVSHSRFASLEAFLSGLRSHPPVLITIARSIEGFTSVFHIPELETRTLAMLHRVWGHLGVFQASRMADIGGSGLINFGVDSGVFVNSTAGAFCSQYAKGTSSLNDFQQVALVGSSRSQCYSDSPCVFK